MESIDHYNLVPNDTCFKNNLLYWNALEMLSAMKEIGNNSRGLFNKC